MRLALGILFLCFLSLGNPYTSVMAQGNLSASFETNSILYHSDASIDASTPDNRLGSNNYFKIDYAYKQFKAGIQYEAYLPVLQGLPNALTGNQVAFKYASYQQEGLNVTVGDFYEQFGNGLILRAYEERALGLNTSLEGVRIGYEIGTLLQLKGLVSRPRLYMERAESTIGGASISVDVAQLFRSKLVFLDAELGFVNRYINYTGQRDVDPNVQAYSLKTNALLGRFQIQGEYAYKSDDASIYNANLKKDGSALLLEVGYSSQGFGISAMGRRLEYMHFGNTRESLGIGRDLNYLPALTKQHSYALANLNPHNTMGNEEIGGQLDINYRVKPNSFLGGEHGTLITLNASSYYNLKGDAIGGYHYLNLGDTHYYKDLNVDVDRKINDHAHLRLFYSNQTFNPITIGKNTPSFNSDIAVADLTWMLSNKKSMRFELQHLWSKGFQKNWVAALAEISVGTQWSCFLMDMYNYGSTDIHYYKIGGSFTKSKNRIALNYGRNREGIICVGGVCLYMPAFTGLNLSLISSF